ncbi:MAG TPA: hypothetical protein VIL11_01140 [Limnochordales bacterium]
MGRGRRVAAWAVGMGVGLGLGLGLGLGVELAAPPGGVPWAVAGRLLAASGGRARAQAAEPAAPPEQAEAPPGPAGQDSPEGFRGVPWGASREQVMAAEGRQPFAADERRLVFLDSLLGYQVAAVYSFTDSMLTQAAYVLVERFSNYNRYLEVFGELKEALQAKYGPPEQDQTLWSVRLYRDDPEMWGFAVAMGHLSRLAGWQTPKTRIGLGLTGNNGEVYLAVVYWSVDYEELTDRRRREAAGAKL